MHGSTNQKDERSSLIFETETKEKLHREANANPERHNEHHNAPCSDPTDKHKTGDGERRADKPQPCEGETVATV